MRNMLDFVIHNYSWPVFFAIRLPGSRCKDLRMPQSSGQKRVAIIFRPTFLALARHALKWAVF